MAEDILSFTIEEEIKYNTKDGIRIRDLIKSLESLEELTKQTKGALSDLLGVKIKSIDLKVSEVREGSMIEKVHAEVKYYNENKDDVDKQITKFVKKNKMKVGVFGAVLAGIAAFGVWHYVTSDPTQNINLNVSGSYNNVIVSSAGAVGVPSDEFKTMIENSPTNKKSLAKSAIGFINPAKKGNDSVSISFSGNNVTLPVDLVKQTPEEYITQAEEKSVELKDVTLNIRASDRDSYDKGWYGFIDGLFSKRVRIDIPTTIDLNVLSKQEAVKADVVLYSTQKGDKTDYKHIEVKSINTK